MADSPHLADFLAKAKGSGAGTKAGLLPPIIAPGLFASISGASDTGNYNSLNRIGQRIQQARADADQAHIMKVQKEREKKLMKMIKDLQKQARASVSAPSSSAPSSFPSIGRRGTGLSPSPGVNLPVIGGGGNLDSILPIIAPPPRIPNNKPTGVRFPQIF